MAALPVVADGTVVADFDTELVVLVPGRRRAYHLDTAAALVFDSCRRGDELEELVDELVSALEIDELDVRNWLTTTLVELEEGGLIRAS